MQATYIEITGKTLLDLINDGEIDIGELHRAGVIGDSILRINHYGEIELRRKEGWDMIGGLLGDYENRLHRLTHLDWA